jgi:cysteine desulfurase
VLQAIGRSDELARASIRFGLSRFNTEEEVDEVIKTVTSLVSSLRSGSAFDEFESDTQLSGNWG